MDIKITTELNGERREYKGFAGFIRSQLDYLRQCRERKSSRNPALLDDDIRAYECILEQPDPEAAAKAYKNERATVFMEPKRDTVTRLGYWK